MDDEGSGSDSENSEDQGSTNSFLGEPVNSVLSDQVRGPILVRGSRLKTTNMEIMS